MSETIVDYIRLLLRLSARAAAFAEWLSHQQGEGASAEVLAQLTAFAEPAFGDLAALAAHSGAFAPPWWPPEQFPHGCTATDPVEGICLAAWRELRELVEGLDPHFTGDGRSPAPLLSLLAANCSRYLLKHELARRTAAADPARLAPEGAASPEANGSVFIPPGTRTGLA